MGAGWVEIGRAIYGGGLLLACIAFLRALPSVLRVVGDLARALHVFSAVLANSTAEADERREQLELTRAIADRLGVRAEVPRRASPRPMPPSDAPEIGDALP